MSKPHINVTPLIDVLLVLLIIFMVITPLKPGRFEARIPQEPSKDAAVDTNPDTIIVAIEADSTLRLNSRGQGAFVETQQALVDELKEIFRQREQNQSAEKTVFVKAPRKLSYGSVAKVIDAVKSAGARPISLQIDRID